MSNKEEIENSIKRLFLEKLEASLACQPLKEISGAADFLTLLQSMNKVIVSLATGGWGESAILKLASANINCSTIPLTSSNDHPSSLELG